VADSTSAASNADKGNVMTEQADVVVIGLGPGGGGVAESLASAGVDVVGVERELVGGECPYWGCIPSKMIIRAANLIAEARRIPGVAGASTVTPDWAPVAARIRREATDTWDDRVAVERFEGLGGRFIRGSGRLDGRSRVVIGDCVVEARRGVVIATGASAVVPPIPGLADVDHWTNRGFIETETLPRSLLVLGGGAIGLELAQASARFGVRVTVVEGMERLLAMEEPEAGDELGRILGAEGLDIITGRHAMRVTAGDGGITVELDDGSRASGERILVATGRRPNIASIGLETIGLDPSARSLDVDERCRVVPGVWAVGDCTGKGFTHASVYMSRIVVADILGRSHAPAAYHAMPRVTFTDPEVGAVGLTEQQARERGLAVRTGTGRVAASTRGWIHGPGNDGFIKLVEDVDRGVLVGTTSMGPVGGEVLSMFSVAVHAAVPTTMLREMIYAYPTFHRGVEDALADLAA
jgi:pyruvate/2-oxoglutarate dehydrogenase complex dihydrolipoamide dehydrogenase (E3) component